jgi:hypothetical protein
MKTTILLATFVLLTGISGLFAQNLQINPIPSYNVQISDLNTGFRELKSHGLPTREKRDMEVVISSSSTSPIPVFAKVWVVKENSGIILGPFTAFDNEQITVPIDNGQWSVVIRCAWDVNASVWID